MEAALIILAALVAVGLPLYILDKAKKRDSEQAADATEEAGVAASAEADDEGCCGMHITCEKDSLLAGVSSEIVYYDDEELDRFQGREPDQYADAEIEEFRDVLLTLLPTDIAGWGRSLQLRGINLPAPVREELLLIVSEARKS